MDLEPSKQSQDTLYQEYCKSFFAISYDDYLHVSKWLKDNIIIRVSRGTSFGTVYDAYRSEVALNNIGKPFGVCMSASFISKWLFANIENYVPFDIRVYRHVCLRPRPQFEHQLKLLLCNHIKSSLGGVLSSEGVQDFLARNYRIFINKSNLNRIIAQVCAYQKLKYTKEAIRERKGMGIRARDTIYMGITLVEKID